MIVVFVDRDGVINENRDDYVKTEDEMVMLPSALEGLARLKQGGATTIVISNQAGVGRGLISLDDLERINCKLLGAVASSGGEIAATYYCTHNRDEGCECRKPGIGLLSKAAEDFRFDLADAYLVGDANTDIEAGNKAGCKTILVLTGRTSRADLPSWNLMPWRVASDLREAAEWILANENGH
jgi:D-glycero-D-manno-heptose 1,7-bisphosphate phosphatase